MNANELRFASLKVLNKISPIWSIKLLIWMNKILYEYFEFIWMPRSLNLRRWRFWVTFHQSGVLRSWLEWIGHSLNGLTLLNAKELNLHRLRFWVLFLQYEELSCWLDWILPCVNDLSSFESRGAKICIFEVFEVIKHQFVVLRYWLEWIQSYVSGLSSFECQGA